MTRCVNCDCRNRNVQPCPNPIVKIFALRRVPGWTVRVYADGMMDATKGLALTPGFSSFSELSEWFAAQMLAGQL